jgi:hypothetical protein
VASFIAAIDFTRPPPPTFAQSPEQLVADLDARQRKQMTSSRPTLNDAEARSSGCRLRVTDGGVWWTQPEDAPQHWATVGQLTVPTDSVWRLTVNLQGRRPLWLSDGTTIGTGCQKCAGPDEDWVERGVVFTSRASDDVRTYVHVLPSVRRVAADGITGHETLRLEVALNPSALNVYGRHSSVPSACVPGLVQRSFTLFMHAMVPAAFSGTSCSVTRKTHWFSRAKFLTGSHYHQRPKGDTYWKSPPKNLRNFCIPGILFSP